MVSYIADGPINANVAWQSWTVSYTATICIHNKWVLSISSHRYLSCYLCFKSCRHFCRWMPMPFICNVYWNGFLFNISLLLINNIENTTDLCAWMRFLKPLLISKFVIDLMYSNWIKWSSVQFVIVIEPSGVQIIQGVIAPVILKFGWTQSATPIWNYKHDYSVNCMAQGPITNLSCL